MHGDDIGMVERGDMFWNREKRSPLLGAAAPILFSFGKAERFSPDVILDEGFDLSAYGFPLRVVSLPAHSKGSIGLLAETGDLFCGDLFVNEKKPALNDLFMDPAATRTSVDKLVALGVGCVYPSHGGPFDLKAGTASR